MKYISNNKSIIKGLLTIFIYFILRFFTYLPLYLLNINPNSLSFNAKIIYLIIYEIIALSIILLILNKEIFNDFKDFKNKFKLYFKKYFVYWFLLLFLMITSNLIIQLIYPGSSSLNEDSFRNTFSYAPIYAFISACLFAPIIEELIFRMCIKKIVKNKYLFIFASSFIFGSLHIIGNISNSYDLLYLFPYLLPGLVLSYVYYSSNNIFTSIGIHFIHNTVLVIIQFLSSF